MHIAVLLKQVPDTDEIRMDEEKGTMIREGAGTIINPLDLHALQAALDLRPQDGGRISVISMGPPQAEKALREAIALGADEVLFLSDPRFAAADTWATAKTLAAAIRKYGPFDLILAGEKATDGETGQVGPEVAAMLDLPFSTYVSGLSFHEGAGVVVSRTVEDGIERQRLPLPCLLTVLRDLNEPVMPTLEGKKKGRRIQIQTRGLEDLGLDPGEVGLAGSPTRVVRIFHPQVERTPLFYRGKDLDKGIAQFVDELERRGVLTGGENHVNGRNT
ncbi:MAG: electron transfer flavoprotein subunit beta/FixA family protein [Thermovirgaceae bacterium]